MLSKINKDNIDHLLFEVAKEYKRLAKKHAVPIYMTIVGGGSILLLHNFRTMSADIDSIIFGNSVFDEAIMNVAKRNDLPYDWINSDFIKTSSYSSKLPSIASDFKKYCGILNVTVVDDEYLVAMKLASFRNYKHDISDIIGIIKDMYDGNKNIDINVFEDAYYKLYGTKISVEAHNFLFDQLNNKQFLNSYNKIKEEEIYIGNKVIENKEKIKNETDLDSVIKEIKNKLNNK